MNFRDALWVLGHKNYQGLGDFCRVCGRETRSHHPTCPIRRAGHRKDTNSMDKVLEYAKAVIAACVAAAVAALAGVDWQAVIGAAVGSGVLTGAVPNKKKRKR